MEIAVNNYASRVAKRSWSCLTLPDLFTLFQADLSLMQTPNIVHFGASSYIEKLGNKKQVLE